MEIVYKMNWSQSTIFRFIELYRLNRCLWDPQDDNHKSRSKLREAWENIQRELGMPCTITDLKKKKESLMSAYRAYNTKIKRCELEGTVFEPTWTYFETMHSFLGPVYTCNVTHQSGDEDNENYEEKDSDGEEDEESAEVRAPKVSKKVILTTKRRHYPIEQRPVQIEEIVSYAKPIEESISFVKEPVNFTKPEPQIPKHVSDDDECSTFGLLITKKLRKLSEDRRDVMMVKINQLFVDEYNERNLSRPHSTSMFSSTSPSTSYDPLLVEVKPIIHDRS